MPMPPLIAELIERFQANIDSYKAEPYKEAQVRKEFIDPFFAALGWDMENKGGFAEAYKEVVHEDSLKIGVATKAPDYSFRIGANRIFFVEAKKPRLNIHEDAEAAFQLRRYAWSAGLLLSIITDFEEFAVYDCTVRPHVNDGAGTARVMYSTYRELPERWDQIAGIFSRESVLKGSFDHFAKSTRGKRGTAPVDEAFLGEIEGWREALAKNLAVRNEGLSQEELNVAVQRILDRIIFLRICEDRAIEPYGKLRNHAQAASVYRKLCKYFREADARYNSGLFHFAVEAGRPEREDTLTLALDVDDKLLKDIIQGLYYPQSPYEFSVISSDILGQVYEQFLGKIIRLTAGHRAVVEEKPEVRRAGGVYYTPPYVVNYIVKATLGKLLKGKAPHDVAKVRVLDPACGSGSFLVGAYQFLLDWHRDYYLKDGPRKHRKELHPTIGGEWRLSTAERKRILLNGIFGVDIDSQAVEVTKLSLLLKVLEGESDLSINNQLRLIQERALPDLGNNIKCGNSLISTDFQKAPGLEEVSRDEVIAANPFDWNKEFASAMSEGGFDVVLGNPPYDVMEKDRGAASWPHWMLSEYVRLHDEYNDALKGKLNLFRFFIVRSLALTRQGGRYGMIVPLALLADISCARTRSHLILNTRDLFADCFPQKDNANRRVFKSAKLSTVIISAEKNPTSPLAAKIHVRVYPWNSFEDEPRECTIKMVDARKLDPENLPVPLVDERQWALCRKLYSQGGVLRLGEVPDFIITRGEINQTVYRDYIVDDPSKSRMLKGVEVGRYVLNANLKQGKREWFDERRYLQQRPPRTVASLRRIATQRITGVDERLRVVATIVEPPAYFADSTNSVHLNEGAWYRLEYLLALLNSKLYQWRFKLTSTNNNVGTNELECMPFPTIDFTDPGDEVRHARVVRCVEEMFRLQEEHRSARTDHARESIRRQLVAKDDEIDTLVFELFKLQAGDIQEVLRVPTAIVIEAA